MKGAHWPSTPLALANTPDDQWVPHLNSFRATAAIMQQESPKKS